MLRLYHYEHSANCYKVRLLLAQLGLACELVPIDLLQDEQFSEDFQRISISRKVPLLMTESGEPLAESAAILCFLAEGTRWFPSEPGLRSQVLQWLFYEQWSMGRSIMLIYSWTVSWGLSPERTGDLDSFRHRGTRVLAELDRHLHGRDFFVGDRYTIADIALFGYTQLAPRAGFDLGHLHNLQGWLERVRSQPNHVAFSGPPTRRANPAALPVSLRG